MKRTRWPVVILLIAAVAALVAWFPGREGVQPSRVLRSPVAAAVGAAGGSWYCAARDVGVESPTQTVIVSSASEDGQATIRVDGFGEEGPAGDAEFTLEPMETAEIDVAAELGSANLSVMVEADMPVVVEHRFTYDAGADQAPCSTFSSDTWYFPTVVTSRDANARLSLFNPFPGDASVDIEVAFDTGVRQPTALSGLVIPAGTTRVVELGEQVQRRDQFSATIKSRSGGVVAELAQRFDGTGDVPVVGLRLVPGTRATSATWSFAGGFADATALENLVVLNPGEDDAELLAQVVPYGGTNVMPEPFELKVPGLRYGTINLTEESRVPQVGYHAISLETSGGAAVVPARSINVTGPPEATDADPLRAKMTGGTTASAGAAASARKWHVSAMSVGEQSDGAVLVHNGGTDEVVATVTSLSIDGSELESADYELPPGESAVVPAADLAGGEAVFTAVVTADSPVVVERLIVWSTPADISLQAGIPVVGSLDGLEGISG